MTNREQFWIAAVIVAVLLIIWWACQPAESAQVKNYDVYVVQPGDTLNAIAKKYRPDKDWREVVWEIEQLNSITPMIFSGQRIKVPVE